MEIGSKLGPYRLVGVLGRGGMGEVYRGHDSSLGRDVAIKVLPKELAADTERLGRLRREARVLAALSHPNVATVFGFEEEDGQPFLVLELVEGETLAERVARGPMPLLGALRTGRQLAAALAAAHDRGIVHRDFKPANVMLTPGGHVKLLDFGLARRRGPADDADQTLSDDLETRPGRVMGTLPYMSPEQLRGLPVDQGSDIWAFGCVLYEAITGKRPFHETTSSDLIVAILEHEPDERLLTHCPTKIKDLIRRCLRKDSQDRLHSMADARIEIDEALVEGARASPSERGSTRRRPGMLAVAGLAVAAMAAAFALGRARGPELPADEPVRRFTMDLGDGNALAFGIDYPASVAIAPQGDVVAFVADTKGERAIHVRALDEINSRLLPGTDGAQLPFFSPDGRSLGFFAAGKLKKISLRGGAPVVLSAAPKGMGGAWSPEGWIVFAPSDSSGLWRVPEAGGEAEAFSRVKPESGEQAHWNPLLLPDGRTVIFTAWTGGRNADSRLAMQRLGEKQHRPLLEGASQAAFLPPDHLIYGRSRELLAVRFDPSRGTLLGTPFRVLEGVLDTPATGSPVFTVGAPGTLVFAPALDTGPPGRVLWLDRTGHVVQEIESGHAYYRPRLSPDGTRVAYHLANPDFDVWIKDLGRGTRQRLTKSTGWDGFAVWSPDSKRVAFSSFEEGSRTLFLQAADGSGAAERLLPPHYSRWPTSWSSNGDWLAYYEEDPETAMDIWLLDMRSHRPVPFLRTRFREAFPRFSPDGSWLAYHSDESGVYEAYLHKVADPTVRLQVSAGGGLFPFWSASGDEIYYSRGSQLVRVRIGLGRPPRAGPPEALFSIRDFDVNDVHPDGHRFLAVDAPTSLSVTKLQIVLGWRAMVTRLGQGS